LPFLFKLKIKNKFTSSEIDYISGKIFTAIQKEKRLTNRPLEYIKKSLKSGFFFVAVEKGNHVTGFIIKEKLFSDYYEIKSWYISPGKRNSGSGSKLMNSALSDKSIKYLCVTFQPKVTDILKHYGFKQISLNQLPMNLLIKYVITRNLISVIRHVFVKKSYLMIKQ